MEAKILILTIPLSVTDEKLFIRNSFRVPAGVESLGVSFSADDPNAAVIDFALEDPDGFRGWSGFTTGSINIEQQYATPGYRPGSISSGEWIAVLGVPKIRTYCQVTITIEMKFGTFKWYPGDFHMHTFHSDGQFSAESVQRFAVEQNLGVIALTDHNTQTQNTDIKDLPNLVVIPSMELTTYKGHLNFWNLGSQMKNVLCDTEEQVSSAVSEARMQGAVISLNHPFFKDPWLWSSIPEVDAVEVWNGSWSEGNRKALQWWHEQLCSGRRICAVGGSDNHRFNHDKRWFGTPTTWIGTDNYSASGILEGIKNSSVIITAEPNAPQVYLSSSQPGCISVTLKNTCRGTLLLVSDEGVESTVDIEGNEKQLEYGHDRNHKFIRAEFWGEDSGLLCLTNPLFHEELNPAEGSNVS